MKIHSMCLLFLLPVSLLWTCPAFSKSDTAGSSQPQSPDTQEKTILEKQIRQEKKAASSPNIISLHRPNYVLPYYYTASPYQAIYLNSTPNNQLINKEEFKAQLSLKIPILRNLIKKKPLSLNFAYTQLMYWQFYAKSQYFRETNYEPELYLEHDINSRLQTRFGVDHQSNGRGGELERSWNRLVVQLNLSGNRWLVGLRGWALIGTADSSKLHNPDIAHYLGYENLLFAHELPFQSKLSVEIQNIESGLKRGFVQATLSFPILDTLSIYGQFFSGYGQSLIEYNHRTTSAGIGIVLNDWIS
ncbi:phospholipase A [Legionella spiritensis]|uniref:Phospholipase A1 n=1 Tax=Legionella spiritensis TaxID=452 RepID=A0A0W0ZC20_LEGSP|nr:phospholipase A [Legionella spiritensis]KTD66334.1 Phospholipase A1 precursor [Legionella spiritensis]SNV48683.1 Phospholipase A1 precursor [Legionella spiritensis]